MTAKPLALPTTAVLFLLILSTGCGTPVPLGAAEDAVFDADLVGLWQAVPSPDADDAQMLVLQFNDREYYVELREPGSEPFGEEVLRLRAYLTDLDGHRFVNLQGIDPEDTEREFIFYRYALDAAGLLTITEVELGDERDEEFETTEELRAFVRARLDDPALYGDTARFMRLDLVN